MWLLEWRSRNSITHTPTHNTSLRSLFTPPTLSRCTQRGNSPPKRCISWNRQSATALRNRGGRGSIHSYRATWVTHNKSSVCHRWKVIRRQKCCVMCCVIIGEGRESRWGVKKWGENWYLEDRTLCHYHSIPSQKTIDILSTMKSLQWWEKKRIEQVKTISTYTFMWWSTIIISGWTDITLKAIRVFSRRWVWWWIRSTSGTWTGSGSVLFLLVLCVVPGLWSWSWIFFTLWSIVSFHSLGRGTSERKEEFRDLFFKLNIEYFIKTADMNLKK